MSKAVGRQRVYTDEGITIRFNPSALSILEEGTHALSRRNGLAPSRASWFRYLLDECFQHVAPSMLISAEDLATTWTDDWLQEGPVQKVVLRISTEQRIYLRQWECHVQSLDWTRILERNETVQILVAAQGPIVNRLLGMGGQR